MTLRIAVLSDVHGNAFALEAVLAEIERDGVDRIVCLGDALQGGAQPARTADLLRELGCPVVMGNADDYLLSGNTPEPMSDKQRVVREWTLEQIGPSGADLVSTFVPTLTVDLEAGEQMLCFHGTPRSFDEIVLPRGGLIERITGDAYRDRLVSDETFEEMIAGAPRLLTGGHTHLQWMRTFGGRTYFNPGSVGLSYNRLLPRERFHFGPAAEYAVVTSCGRDGSIEFRHVLLDADALAATILASGHPYASEEAARWRRPEEAA